MFRASAVLVLVLAAVTLLGPDISAQDPNAVEESRQAAADLAGGTSGAGQTVPPCPEPDEEDYVTPVPVIGLGFPGADGKPAPFEDKFFFVMNDRFRLYLKNDAPNDSGDPCPKASGMKVEITARGFRPMLTLADDVIILKPQESTTVPVKQTRIGLRIEKHGEDDLLGGMEIRVRAMPEGRDSP
jgi:hypothetical protein